MNSGNDDVSYQRTAMRKDMVISRLKQRGCRITKQRLTLLDIILKEECSCCKELYYKAVKLDRNIGKSTVYRLINLLEDVGAINRNNMYKVDCLTCCERKDGCVVELSDCKVCRLSAKQWYEVIRQGLKMNGYINEEEIRSVVIKSGQ